MTTNGTLPDFLLIYSEATGWYIADRHGKLFFNNVFIRPGTMLEMLADAGANYQVIDPRKYQKVEERTPNVIPPGI